MKKLIQKIGQRAIIPRQKVFTRDELRSFSVVDNGEKMIAMPAHQKITFADNTETKGFMLRESVIERIIHVADHLPNNLRLVVFECYRSIKEQEHRRVLRFNSIKTKNPNLSDNETWKIVDQFVSRSGGPHQTGGAIDLTLAYADTGKLLDMGTNLGEPSPASWTNSEKASWEAQCNRAILWNHMRSAGFCNYAAEWWHYEFGTVRWALSNGLNTAFYGIPE